MATIITIHAAMNDATAPGQLCPAPSIHTIDNLQPPGIGMPPDIALHK